jgi:hypothetical protein
MLRKNGKLLAALNRGLALSSALTLLAAGCNKDESVPVAAANLQRAFQSQQTEAVPQATETPKALLPTAQINSAKQLVQQAVGAMQSNAYAAAFATLRVAQTAPGITVDQYDAIEKARLAVEREMAAKAVSGDPNARQSLEAIQSLGH